MERELRYCVLKISDMAEALSFEEIHILHQMYDKVRRYREQRLAEPLECLVIEKDWPEYEPTWAIIEARVDRQQKLIGEILCSNTTPKTKEPDTSPLTNGATCGKPPHDTTSI